MLIVPGDGARTACSGAAAPAANAEPRSRDDLDTAVAGVAVGPDFGGGHQPDARTAGTGIACQFGEVTVRVGSPVAVGDLSVEDPEAFCDASAEHGVADHPPAAARLPQQSMQLLAVLDPSELPHGQQAGSGTGRRDGGGHQADLLARVDLVIVRREACPSGRRGVPPRAGRGAM